ncbi:hypothetical protein [Streptomyces gibsoniae]|uniref:Uncharacterized protein n=1 Tax=Streptomyces gibsoniae TaxID=3075529 RepID=A0ABU2TU22_9ACTN|nr:hypothetical protein [Streptomyces sp. DSM 41699]MDT0464453.1 hypothetical protein [Streptomyces sp. DSM 41699]
MGTGIVADAAATLPRTFLGLRDAATVVWSGAALLLVVLTVSYVRQRALRGTPPIRYRPSSSGRRR